MKKTLQSTLFLSLLWGIATLASAQSLNVQTDVVGTGDYKAVKVGDTWHAVESAQVTFLCSFTEPTLNENQRNLSIKNVSCDFNGEIKEGQLNNTNIFEYTVISAQEYGPATLTVEYSYEEFTGQYEQKEETQDVLDENGEVVGTNTILVDDLTKPIYETISPEPLVAYGTYIQVWETPSVEVSSTERVYSLEDRTFNVMIKGGCMNWQYKWNDELGDVSYVQSKPQSLPGWVQTKIEVTNYAPDGTTVWYYTTISPETYFYDTPIITKKDISRKNFYKSTGNTVWEIETRNGGSIYEIEWTGGEMDGQGLTYSPYPSEVSSTLTNRVIHATVVNKADDGYELYREVLDFDAINIYRAANFISGRESMSVYAGEEVNFKGEIDGGNPDGWICLWNTGDVGLQLTDNPMKTTTYILTAQNVCDGIVCETFEQSYTANVFPTPSLNVNEELSIYGTDGGLIYTPTIEANIQYPQTSAEGKEYHLILGNNVEIHPLASGGVSEGWVYRVYNGDTEITNMKFEPTSVGVYNIRVEFTNGEGVVEHPYSGTVSRQYVVYDKPQLMDTNTEIHLLPGQSEFVKAVVMGGEESGWTFIWDNGNSGTDFNFEAGEVSKKTVFEQTLTVENICEGLKQFSATRTYKFVVWPQPKISDLAIRLKDKEINKVKNIVYFDKSQQSDRTISIECYDGDVLDIVYSVEGGYTGDDNCWTYQNTKKALTYIPYTTDTAERISQTDEVVTSCGNQAYSEETFYLRFSNGPDKSQVYSSDYAWLDEQYTVNIKVWHLPSIQEVYTDSASTAKWKDSRINVYAGGMEQNNVNLIVNNQYGNTATDGWTYSWTEDGIEVSTQLAEWAYVPSTDENHYTDKMLGVHITNKIGDNYALDRTIRYPIRVWHKVSFDSQFLMTDNNRKGAVITKGIREGNVYTYRLNKMNDGYFLPDSSSYVYDWDLGENNNVNTSVFEFHTSAPSISTDKGMDVTNDITDRLVLYNNGPYGHVWEQRALPAHTYRIYHKPSVPASLVRKGSFATGTLAVSMPSTMSDTDLNTYDYNLVFGYVDANGNDVDLSGVIKQEGSGTVRWYQIPATARSYENYYVYAVWEYTDGAKITSGKRYLNPKGDSYVDEEWDGSTYDEVDLSTRAFIIGPDTATGIQVVSSEMNGVGENEAPLIYTLDGQLVKNPENIKHGIYLFETNSNGKRITKKVFVK